MTVDVPSTAASSITRNGSCRKNKGVKHAVEKRSMQTKTVSHLQNKIATQLGYEKLTQPLIELLKKSFDKHIHTGFAVMFFKGKQTTSMSDIMLLLHARWTEVISHAHQCIPDEKKNFSTCIVTPYFNNETEQMHLYFMYSEFNYDALINRLSKVIRKIISQSTVIKKDIEQ